MQRKEIRISKVKLIKQTFISIIFVIACIWVYFSGGAGNRYPEASRKFWGIAGIIFFGACLLFILWKFFDTRPGLIIDSKGITDNTSPISVGFIPWRDILGVYNSTVSGQTFLSISIKDPDKYLSQQNILKRAILIINMKMCGTPINISASGLDCNFNDLERMITSAFSYNRASQ